MVRVQILCIVFICILNHVCGLRTALLKMFGGREVERYLYPWQAMIYTKYKGRIALCSGVLVHPYWVLTSENCHSPRGKEIAYFGVWNRTNVIEGGRTSHHVEYVIRNTCYNKSGPEEYKLVMMKLRTPEFRHVPVCLSPPATDDFKHGKIASGCVAVGYGVTEWGQYAKILRSIHFSSSSTSLCPKQYKNHRTICSAGGTISDAKLCKGDTGSPLLCPSSESGCHGYHLAGISFGFNSPCASSQPINLFAPVHQIQPWITAVVNQDVNFLRNSCNS